MSIANLYSQGKKDQDLAVDNLDVLNDITTQNLSVSGSLSVSNLDVSDLITTKDLLATGSIQGENITANSTIFANGASITSANINNIINDTSTIQNLTVETSTNITGGNLNVVNDIISSSGEITSENDITSNNGNITSLNGNCVAEQFIPTQTAVIGSLNISLISSGIHTWGGGITKGINPLNITLDGNNDVGYFMKFKYVINSTNVNHYVVAFFNSDETAKYSTVMKEQNSSNSTGVINQNNGRLIEPRTSTSVFGVGSFDMLTFNNSVLTNCSVIGQNIIQLTGGGSNAQIQQVGINYFDGPIPSDVTQITIDTNNGNHTGMTLLYRLFKYQ
jgi:hypothetical protein